MTGVGFRAHTQREAQRLALVSYVRNRADGAVEGEAEGPTAAVDEFVRWLHRGPTWERVDHVAVTPLAAGAGEAAFAVWR